MHLIYIIFFSVDLTHNELPWSSVKKSNKNQLKEKVLDPNLGFTTNQSTTAGAAAPPPDHPGRAVIVPATPSGTN
jgi:hypothetical protein